MPEINTPGFLTKNPTSLESRVAYLEKMLIAHLGPQYIKSTPQYPHPSLLSVIDIDDTPVDGATTTAISSNWAFDHVAAADPHTGYLKESDFNAKGDLISASADNTPATLTVGANDTILMADSAQAAGLKWVAPATPVAISTANAEGTSDDFARGSHVHAHETAHCAHDTVWAAKGDLLAGTANDTAQILSVGTNTYLLQADSSQTTGLIWQSLAWTAYSFTAGDFTASTGNWTVASGDINSGHYLIIGKTMFLAMNIYTTTVSATPANLFFKIPASKTCNRRTEILCRVLDAGTERTAWARADAASTNIQITLQSGANFATATDTTYVIFSMVFEIQ